MRTERRNGLLATLAATALLPWLPFACLSNTPPLAAESDDAGFLEDTGVVQPDLDGGATQDSAVPSANDAGDSAAPPGDAGSVADAADAAPTTLTLRVIGAAGPEPDVTLVFSDATGALLGTATTDATGSVVEAPPTGTTQVTALLGGGSAQTVIGVALGDALTFVDTSALGSPSIGVSLPPGAPDAATYEIYAGDDSSGDKGGPPFSIGLDISVVLPAVANGGRFPLLATALDSHENTLAFSYQKDNALLADGGGAYAMTGPWSEALGTETISLTNVPVGGAPSLFVSEVTEGVALPIDLAPDAGTNVYATHVGFADTLQTEGDYYTNGSPGIGGPCQAVAASSAASATATATLDLSQLLPVISFANVGTTDAGAALVTWDAAGSLASATGIVVQFAWTGSTDAGSFSGYWTLLSPPGVSSVTVPQLPSTASAWTPPAGASFFPEYVAAVSGSALPSYAAVRPLVAEVSLIGGCSPPLVPALPQPGSASLTMWNQSAE